MGGKCAVMNKLTCYKVTKTNVEIALLTCIIWGIDQIILKRQEFIYLYTDAMIILTTITSVNMLKETKLDMWKIFSVVACLNFSLTKIMDLLNLEKLTFSIYSYVVLVVLLLTVALSMKYLYEREKAIS
ncbi:hypothetical protein OZX60_05685 [Streptococcaceae bacterium ESL0687]|nr:hypothetical protein OZX60_05685 [Streptococcaceae bacterium ESL0687]